MNAVSKEKPKLDIERLAAIARDRWRDGLYAATVATLSVLAILPWWSSDLLPPLDHSSFLTFVRVFGEVDDPGSPFHGTHELGSPLTPTAVVVWITSGFAKLCGSVEVGAKVFLTVYALALPASAAFLLRTLGQNRWCIVLVFPLVLSRLASWGFFAFMTAVPLLLLLLALSVRFFERRTVRLGVGIAALLTLIALWHAMMAMIATLFAGVLWLCWKAPSWRAKLVAVTPVLPAMALQVLWRLRFTAQAAGAKSFAYPDLEKQFDLQYFFSRTLWLYPNADVYAKLAVTLFVLARLLSPPEEVHPDSRTAGWHVKNPFAVVSFVALCCFFALPYAAYGVELLRERFASIAAVLFAIGWRLPARKWAQATVVGAAVALGGVYLLDVGERFRDFHRETVGASRLISSIGDRETLVAPIPKPYATKAFPLHHPLRHLQQYATVRKGGLPTMSFANKKFNYVHWTNGRNPMPFLHAHNWTRHRGLSRFDYVLVRKPNRKVLRLPKIKLLRRDGDWFLFGVCGSAATPSCR